MLKASNVQMCVIYDPENGQIIHVHKEIAIGRLQRTEAEIETRARMFASRQGGDTENPKAVIARDIDSLKAVFVKDIRSKNRHYKVDTETLKLVEVKASKH